MTASRWWVRSFARWLARIDGVKGQLNLFFTAMSGVSLASGVLKYLGAPLWVIASFLAAMSVGLVVYIWYYTEGGVWNQVQRDRNDLSTNFSGPTMLMDDILIAHAVYAANHGEPPDAEDREVIEKTIRNQWQEFRDGVPIDGVDHG